MANVSEGMESRKYVITSIGSFFRPRETFRGDTDLIFFLLWRWSRLLFAPKEYRGYWVTPEKYGRWWGVFTIVAPEEDGGSLKGSRTEEERELGEKPNLTLGTLYSTGNQYPLILNNLPGFMVSQAQGGQGYR